MTDDPERRLAEALRAQARGAPQSGPMRPGPLPPGPMPGSMHSGAVSPGPSRAERRAAETPPSSGVRTALLLALLAGAVIGTALALLSLWVPGALPALG